MMSLTTVAAAAAVAIVLAVPAATPAEAQSQRLQNACGGDYMAYCGRHPPEQRAAVGRCMRAHRRQLSSECISAMVADGKISRAEASRREVRRHRRR